MPSYMVMMPLKRAASASAFWAAAAPILGVVGPDLLDLGFDAPLGRLQQALADLDLSRALLQLLPARLQPFQDRALGG